MSFKILVIDDEEGVRFTFERFLRAEGYAVTVAENFKEALDRINETNFDVLFADIVLDDGTGIDILREVRRLGLSCPVIVITGDPSVDTAADSVRLGAFDYIPKPIDQEALLCVVQAALKHKTVNDEKEKYRTHLEATFRSIKDSIIIVDGEGVILEINEAAMNLCGYTRGAVGKPIDALTRRCSGKCVEILRESVGREHPVEIERVECRNDNGDGLTVSLKTFPLLSGKGMPSGAVMILRNDPRVVETKRGLQQRQQFHRMVGTSMEMQRVYSLVDSLANVQTTVLITGESGTGKELVAEALHQMGERGHKSLVKVNCSALTDTLLESELFGHVKGAFTGAFRDAHGRFLRADGGTIFLDEIGDISPRVQVKLLRVLQEREFERVGDSTPVRVDVRLMAATNHDLRVKVARGEFREDLYYRIKVVEIRVPPLRERQEDIPLLVDHFRKKFNIQFKKKIEQVSPEVLRAFTKHPWPGNVRELEHVMEHAFVISRQSTITLDHLPPDFGSGSGGVHRDLHKDFEEDDCKAVLEALGKTGWNKTKAARLLGVDRVTLYRKIRKYNLAKDEFLC